MIPTNIFTQLVGFHDEVNAIDESVFFLKNTEIFGGKHCAVDIEEGKLSVFTDGHTIEQEFAIKCELVDITPATELPVS